MDNLDGIAEHVSIDVETDFSQSHLKQRISSAEQSYRQLLAYGYYLFLKDLSVPLVSAIHKLYNRIHNLMLKI